MPALASSKRRHSSISSSTSVCVPVLQARRAVPGRSCRPSRPTRRRCRLSSSSMPSSRCRIRSSTPNHRSSSSSSSSSRRWHRPAAGPAGLLRQRRRNSSSSSSSSSSRRWWCGPASWLYRGARQRRPPTTRWRTSVPSSFRAPGRKVGHLTEHDKQDPEPMRNHNTDAQRGSSRGSAPLYWSAPDRQVGHLCPTDD